MLNEEANQRDIACGLRASLAVLEDGRVFSWGNSTLGQLALPKGQELRRVVCLIA